MIKINSSQAFYFTNKLAFHLMDFTDESKGNEYVKKELKEKHPWVNNLLMDLIASALESDNLSLFNLMTMSISEDKKISLLLDMCKITILDVGVSLTGKRLKEFYCDCEMDMDMEHYEIEHILFELMRVTKVKKGILT